MHFIRENLTLVVYAAIIMSRSALSLHNILCSFPFCDSYVHDDKAKAWNALSY